MEEAKGKSGTGSWLSRNVSDARSPSLKCESVATDVESDAPASASTSTTSTCAGMCPKPGRRPAARRMGSLIANKSCSPAPASASGASRSRDSSVDTATTTATATASVTTPSKRVSARNAGAAEKRAREGEEEDEEVAAAEKIPEVRRLLESSPRKTKQVLSRFVRCFISMSVLLQYLINKSYSIRCLNQHV